MTQTTTGTTVGDQILHDAKLNSMVDEMVERIAEQSAQITDVREPNPELAGAFQDLLDRSAAVKGRGLMYPLLGSGAGNGALVEMADGSVKWDMLTGIGVHFLGHGNPMVLKAQLVAGLNEASKHGNLQTNFGAYEFGEKLLEHAAKGSNLRHAFITTSGAIANESALKVCYQKHAPASRVLAFEHCFMGRSVTMCQLGDSAGGRQGVPLSTQVNYVPFYTEAAAEQMGGSTKFIDYAVKRLQRYIDRYPEQYACFIFELVQGEGGFNVAKKEFLKELMACCKANEIAVWDDEIQTFGRTEEMYAYDMYGLGEYVDVLCVGKMTQACATLYTEEYNPKPGLLSGTFTGTTADFTIGNALIDELASGGYYGKDGKFAKHHAEFCKMTRALADKHPEWFPEVDGSHDIVCGVGGMMRMTPFGGDKAKVVRLCRVAYDEGVICFYCGHGPFHLRMLPPLPVMKMEDWARVFACIEKAMSKVASEG